jgi:hypothetical protein
MPRRINPQTFGKEFVEALRDAFDTVGGHEYLIAKSETHPKEFMQLLAKVIPQDINATVQHEIIDVGQAMKDAKARLSRIPDAVLIESVQAESVQAESVHTPDANKPQKNPFTRSRRKMSKPLRPASTSTTTTGPASSNR